MHFSSLLSNRNTNIICIKYNIFFQQNISLDDAAKLNGNDKGADSFGTDSFGAFAAEADSALLHDLERVQRDTTDFCNIQVIAGLIIMESRI